METTIVHWGNIRVILGVYWDNGKENFAMARAPRSSGLL